MKEREFMSIDGLKKVLSPKEMKNITGGSCMCSCGGVTYTLDCTGSEQCAWQANLLCPNGYKWDC